MSCARPTAKRRDGRRSPFFRRSVSSGRRGTNSSTVFLHPLVDPVAVRRFDDEGVGPRGRGSDRARSAGPGGPRSAGEDQLLFPFHRPATVTMTIAEPRMLPRVPGRRRETPGPGREGFPRKGNGAQRRGRNGQRVRLGVKRGGNFPPSLPLPLPGLPTPPPSSWMCPASGSNHPRRSAVAGGCSGMGPRKTVPHEFRESRPEWSDGGAWVERDEVESTRVGPAIRAGVLPGPLSASPLEQPAIDEETGLRRRLERGMQEAGDPPGRRPRNVQGGRSLEPPAWRSQEDDGEEGREPTHRREESVHVEPGDDRLVTEGHRSQTRFDHGGGRPPAFTHR